MVGTIAIAQPFEILSLKSPESECFRILNVQISDPHCHGGNKFGSQRVQLNGVQNGIPNVKNFWCKIQKRGNMYI